jgi:PPOX class probable FMN-dependent enzyme
MPQPTGRFHDVVRTEADLRRVLDEPSEIVRNKVVASLDDVCRRFIARSPFVLIASTDVSGVVDVSPKGDPAGFVKILDEKTLAIPDRLGNNRLDTLRNILQNPNIGLIFLIPGIRETLRVSGTAMIVADAELRETMRVNARLPNFAIVLNVERVLFHCSKCMVRSRLWESEKWPDTNTVPSLAETVMTHARPKTETVADIQDLIDRDIRERLY